MSPLKLVAAVLICALSSGCSICQMATATLTGTENYGPASAYGVVPHGADRASVRFNRLSLVPHKSPPILIVFPDGFRVNSRDVTAETIAEHVGALARDKTHGTVRASSTIRHGNGYFAIGALFDNDGVPIDLYFMATRYTMPAMLGTADGSRFFEFPLSESDFRELFPVPVTVAWQPVGSVYGSCSS